MGIRFFDGLIILSNRTYKWWIEEPMKREKKNINERKWLLNETTYKTGPKAKDSQYLLDPILLTDKAESIAGLIDPPGLIV